MQICEDFVINNNPQSNILQQTEMEAADMLMLHASTDETKVPFVDFILFVYIQVHKHADCMRACLLRCLCVRLHGSHVCFAYVYVHMLSTYITFLGF